MFTERTILLPFEAESRREAVALLVDALVNEGRVPPHREEEVVKAAFGRERLGSTYVADGLAIPHAAIEGFRGVAGCLGISRAGLRWGSGPERAHFVCLLVSLEDDYSDYLAALKSVAGIFGGNGPNIGEDLLNCATPAEAAGLLGPMAALKRNLNHGDSEARRRAAGCKRRALAGGAVAGQP